MYVGAGIQIWTLIPTRTFLIEPCPQLWLTRFDLSPGPAAAPPVVTGLVIHPWSYPFRAECVLAVELDPYLLAAE